MARAAVLGGLTPRRRVGWRLATVTAVTEASSGARALALDVPEWPGHRAGQHVDVRLTAEDGYQAERSYSISSAPEAPEVELTVQRVAGGEVSSYLAGVLEPGDTIEVRGPIGGHFSWSVDDGGPLLLVAGGIGLAPLMAMLRHRAARASTVETRLLYSLRAGEDRLYGDELATLAPAEGLGVSVTYTRAPPPGWTGARGRVDAPMLAGLGAPLASRCFVCGPTGFVERVADLLVDAGHPARCIHAERFGPTGG